MKEKKHSSVSVSDCEETLFIYKILGRQWNTSSALKASKESIYFHQKDPCALDLGALSQYLRYCNCHSPKKKKRFPPNKSGIRRKT